MFFNPPAKIIEKPMKLIFFLVLQMVWAERAQVVTEQARRVKNWILGRRGLILAIVMLVIAAILHRLGYIGA